MYVYVYLRLKTRLTCDTEVCRDCDDWAERRRPESLEHRGLHCIPRDEQIRAWGDKLYCMVGARRVGPLKACLSLYSPFTEALKLQQKSDCLIVTHSYKYRDRRMKTLN